MKIVIDSNVIISSFASRGLCNELFELCISEHKVCLSEYIINECRKNFSKKINLPQNLIKEITAYLRKKADIVEPAEVAPEPGIPEKDLKIIGTAIKCKAKIIITGDRALLNVRKYRAIKILSPREFWKYLADM